MQSNYQQSAPPVDRKGGGPLASNALKPPSPIDRNFTRQHNNIFISIQKFNKVNVVFSTHTFFVKYDKIIQNIQKPFTPVMLGLGVGLRFGLRSCFFLTIKRFYTINIVEFHTNYPPTTQDSNEVL